jgi:hypothetical protein
MKFLQYEVVGAKAGTTFEAILSGCSSDVMLMKTSDVRSFQDGRRYEYSGGHYDTSIVRQVVPSDRDWSLFVVPIGGQVSANFRAF